MLNSDKLIRGYRKEMQCYREILELSGKLRLAFRNGRPLEEIVNILNGKKKIMEDVDKIERWMAEDKRTYRAAEEKPEDVVAVIDELSQLIGEILEMERENEILFNSGGKMNHHSSEMIMESPAYAIGRYSGTGRGDR